jgi:hypothetical protein
MQDSSAGGGSSSMRQMKPGPSWVSPAVVNPAAWRAWYPFVMVASHPRSMAPLQWVRSTTTIAPVVVLQSPMGSALATVVAPTEMTTPAVAAATTDTAVASRPREPWPRPTAERVDLSSTDTSAWADRA